MASRVETVRGSRTLNLNNLGPDMDRWLKQEVRDYTGKVAIEENADQYRIGNVATRVVIDGRTTINLKPGDAKQLTNNSVRFTGLDKRIQFFYTSSEVLIEALTYAWDLLHKLTRVGTTSNAISSYYIWCSDPENRSRSRKFKGIAGAKRWIEDSTSQLINCRILGPTVEYRRKIIYNPQGRKQQTRWVSPSKGINEGKATDRYSFTHPTKSKIHRGKSTYRIAIRSTRGRRGGRQRFQGQVAKAIHEMVVQNVRRQFRDIRVGYRFTRSKELLPIVNNPPRSKPWVPDEQNIHIPELYLSVKTAHGRIKR